MIKKRWTTKRQLESMIRCMRHVGFIVLWVYHFLSHLRSLLAWAQNRRAISINKKCITDLKLMRTILNKAKKGIDMNLLALRLPGCIYYSDSCPAGLGEYSNQGRKRVVFQDARRFAISCVKQPTWIPSSNHNPLDRHHQWTAQPGRLCPLHDWQHNRRGVDAKIQLCWARQRSSSSDDSSWCGKEIYINFYVIRH